MHYVSTVYGKKHHFRYILTALPPPPKLFFSGLSILMSSLQNFQGRQIIEESGSQGGEQVQFDVPGRREVKGATMSQRLITFHVKPDGISRQGKG